MVQPTPSTPVTTTIQELRQSRTMIAEVIGSMNNLQEVFKQRGMGLPPTVLDSLHAVQRELDSVEEVIAEEQTELGQLRALADMSAQITTSLDVDTVLEEAMDIVITLTRAERGYIILQNPQTEEFEFRVGRDNSITPSTNTETGTPDVSLSIIERAIMDREPQLTYNAQDDERFSANSTVQSYKLVSILAVPLLYKDRAIGAVYVDNRISVGLFTEREKNLLTAFANTAAVSIVNARLFADVQTALSQITEVKNLMDNVFASIGSGLIATDAENVITTFNRAAERILELDAHDTIGQPLSAVLPRISTDFQEHLASIRKDQESETIDAELTTREGGRIAIQMKLSPLRDASNHTRGVAVLLDDVTESRNREQQIRVLKTYLPPEMIDNIQQISQLALGGERREVTCLFAEVRPLSTLKDVTPTELMAILNGYLAVATDCVHDTQGIIDKYMGNEVMAMWNTQLSPQENHAHLAIECALRMRDAFVAMYEELGINPDPHFYRIGMHTGVATLGNVGSLNRRDFTAIGDTINLSKRLEENAKSSQIIISESTLAHLQTVSRHVIDRYQFQELEPIQVKGRQKKTRIYEVSRNDR